MACGKRDTYSQAYRGAVCSDMLDAMCTCQISNVKGHSRLFPSLSLCVSISLYLLPLQAFRAFEWPRTDCHCHAVDAVDAGQASHPRPQAGWTTVE